MDNQKTTQNTVQNGSRVTNTKNARAVQPAREPRHSFRRGVLLVGACFLAGLGGAWAYDAMDNTESSKDVQIQRVIAEGEVVTDIAKQVSPSVVSILAETETRDDGFFFDSGTRQGAGTGIIISKNGYVLTNKHVIPSGVTKVSIVSNDGTTYDDVRVVGRDPINDIAFLKINNVNNLLPAKLGDSSKLTVGNKVVAIGNALGEFDATVTSGIVSGVNRSIMAGDATEAESLSNLIQTDAAINPGNSGGPLVNISGEVIGINTAVSEGAEGIGFAIPINEAKGLIEGVLANGKVERGYLGVRYVMLTDDIAKYYNLSHSKGAYIVSARGQDAVVSGSPADKAGLREGDIITRVNGTDLNDKTNLISQLTQHRPGDEIRLVVRGKDGKERTVTAKLEAYQN